MKINRRPGRTLPRTLVILGVFCLCGCSVQKDQKETERYIVDSERRWAESVATGDTSAIERILADDFIGIDPRGRPYGKRQMINETCNAPKYFVSNRLNDVKLRFYGSAALLREARLGKNAPASAGASSGRTLGCGATAAGKSSPPKI